MVAVWHRVRDLPCWTLPLLIATVVLCLPWMGLDYGSSRQVQLACILALLVGGLNLSHGYAGELALGQAAMYAAGAYTAGLMSVAGHTDLLLQMLLGSLAALLIGVVSGVPGLRLGGWSLAMASFFLVLLVPDVVAMFAEQTGGRNGLGGIQPPTLLGSTLAPDSHYLVVVLTTIVWFAVMRNLVVSRQGVAFQVLRQSPVLASSLGISVYRMKLLAYATGAVPAGLAGVLFANLDFYLSPETFGFVLAVTVLAASILGGSASVYGALVGAAIMQFGPNQSTEFQEYALVFTGAFLVIGGVLLRGGVAGLLGGLVRRVDRAAGWTPTDHVPSRAAPALASKGEPLVIEGVVKSFGGNRALDGVDLRAEPGRITALIGPNGSGKTTLLNVVSGFYRTDEGAIHLGGQRMDGRSPHGVARVGVARTFQTPNLPQRTSVREAVAAGRFGRWPTRFLPTVLRTPAYRRARTTDLMAAERAMELVGLANRRHDEAVSLPLGNRRLLELARAVAADPKVVLLDEVASGLDEDEIDRLAALVRQLRDAGGTVLLVEHNFRLVLDLADEIVVLAHGRVIARGAPSAIESDPRVLAEYLGEGPDHDAVGRAAIDEGGGA